MNVDLLRSHSLTCFSQSLCCFSAYRDYLTILLKDKKGQLKGGFGGFTQTVFKHHDESKETGKKANIFEQKVAEMAKVQFPFLLCEELFSLSLSLFHF
jgi:hypothetical protein